MFKDLVVQYVVPVLGTVLSGLAVWALKQLASWLAAKTKSQVVGTALTQVAESVGAAVRHVEMTLRPKLASAAEDGKLSPQEASGLKSAAVSAVLAEVGPAVAALGLSPEKLQEFIGRRIEAAVYEMEPTNSVPR